MRHAQRERRANKRVANVTTDDEEGTQLFREPPGAKSRQPIGEKVEVVLSSLIL